MITVLIADDYQIVRLGLTHIIEEQDDMSVIARAKNGEEAIKKTIDLEPDVVIMDVHMPNMDGLTATEKIKEVNSKSKVIMLTMDDRDDLLFQSLKAGALGYLLKSDSDKDLITAIRTVHEGQIYLKPEDIKRLLENYLTMTRIHRRSV